MSHKFRLMPTIDTMWLDLCLAGIGIYLVKRVLEQRTHTVTYPPGPRGLPLVGNIADIPSFKPWVTFSNWGQTYGDISHVKVLGQHFIILNNVHTAIEMLDKKSSLYSDRPVLTMGGELVGWKDHLVLLPYGDRFREQRKLVARAIGTRAAIEIYQPVQKIETRRFLQSVLAQPVGLSQHIHYAIGAIILRITHGHTVQEGQDPLVEIAERGGESFAASTATGVFLVDMIPMLAYIPDWFPGAGFKLKAKEWRAMLQDMVQKPYELVKERMAAGVQHESFLSNLLEGKILTEEEEHNAKWCAASLYGAGTDTTTTVIYALFLAMTLFPEAQAKAHAEIDAVVGSDRLPTFTDRASLPYLEALIQEVFRWHVVVPLTPHRVTEDDIHGGYFIPKGSTVVPNIWFMLHDPRTYTDPEKFNPERFLVRDGKGPESDPRTICFGFGRRLCPGMLLADASIWLFAAMSLAVFDITKAVENGVEITPEFHSLSGTVSHLKPFKCSITARSAKVLELIQDK